MMENLGERIYQTIKGSLHEGVFVGIVHVLRYVVNDTYIGPEAFATRQAMDNRTSEIMVLGTFSQVRGYVEKLSLDK